jgi:hypothetical protein
MLLNVFLTESFCLFLSPALQTKEPLVLGQIDLFFKAKAAELSFNLFSTQNSSFLFCPFDTKTLRLSRRRRLVNTICN